MNKTVAIVATVGILGIGAYFVYNSTSQQSQFCNGNWTDYVNPLCWLSSSYTAGTNEFNAILIILATLIVLVVALFAFGPQTPHLAKAAGSGVAAGFL